MAHHIFFDGYTDPIPDGWVPDGTEYTLLWKQLYASANFDDGGTWAPSAFVTVGGSGFQFTGTGHSLAASARLNVESTGEIRLKNGALLKADGSFGDIRLEVISNIATLTVQASAVAEIAGTFNLKGTSLTTVESAAEVVWALGASNTAQSGSTTLFEAGAGLTLANASTLSGSISVSATGSIVFAASATITGAASSSMSWAGQALFSDDLILGGGASNWLQFQTARTWTRRKISIALTTFSQGDTTGPADPDTWFEKSPLANTTCVRTATETATGAYCILEWDDLPPNGEIGEINVTSRGQAPSVTGWPQYQLIRWQDGETNYETLSALITDQHSISGNFDTTTATTTITPSATTNIESDWRYGLRVLHPYHAGGNWVYLFDVAIDGTAENMQL